MVSEKDNFVIYLYFIKNFDVHIHFLFKQFIFSDYRSYTTFQLNFDIGSGVKIHDNKIKGTWVSRHLTSGQ